MSDIRLPLAFVKREGRQWVIRRCPWCGEEHRHGAGPRGESLGVRVAHCQDLRGLRYELVEELGVIDIDWPEVERRLERLELDAKLAEVERRIAASDDSPFELRRWRAELCERIARSPVE